MLKLRCRPFAFRSYKTFLKKSKRGLELHTFFISNTFISNALLKLDKNQANTRRLKFCYLKIILILLSRYYLKITGHILKNKQKKKCVCIHEIIRLIIMKVKVKVKNRSHIYSINGPRCRQTPSKCMKFLNMLMLICIKQQLSNI